MSRWTTHGCALGLALALAGTPACYTYPEITQLATEGVAIADALAFVADDLQAAQMRTNALAALDGSMPGAVITDEEVSAALQLAHALREHFDALGQIADPDAVSFDADVGDLADTIQGSGRVGQQEVDAYAALVSGAAEALAGFWRHGTLKDTLKASTDPIARICDLTVLVSDLAVTQYGLELGALDSLAQSPANLTIGALELAAYRVDLDARIQSAQALAKAAAALNTHYGKIAGNPGSLDSDAIHQAAQELLKATLPHTNTLRRRLPRADASPRSRDPHRDRPTMPDGRRSR